MHGLQRRPPGVVLTRNIACGCAPFAYARKDFAVGALGNSRQQNSCEGRSAGAAY